MHLVVIGWLCVVLPMTVAEALAPGGRALGAVFTFLLYGLPPLSIVLYASRGWQRTRRRRRAPRSVSGADPHGGGLASGDAIPAVGEEVLTVLHRAPAAPDDAADPGARKP